MNEEYINYFHSVYLDVSEPKINSLVNGIERKSYYPIALNFHNSSIDDNEKIIKDFEKESNFKKNAARKNEILKIAIPYRNTVKKHQIAIRVLKSLM